MDGLNRLSGANVSFDPGTAWHVVPQHQDLFGYNNPIRPRCGNWPRPMGQMPQRFT